MNYYVLPACIILQLSTTGVNMNNYRTIIIISVFHSKINNCRSHKNANIFLKFYYKFIIYFIILYLLFKFYYIVSIIILYTRVWPRRILLAANIILTPNRVRLKYVLLYNRQKFNNKLQTSNIGDKNVDKFVIKQTRVLCRFKIFLNF